MATLGKLNAKEHEKCIAEITAALNMTKKLSKTSVINSTGPARIGKIQEHMETVHNIFQETEVSLKHNIKAMRDQVDIVYNEADSIKDGIESMDVGSQEIQPFKNLVFAVLSNVLEELESANLSSPTEDFMEEVPETKKQTFKNFEAAMPMAKIKFAKTSKEKAEAELDAIIAGSSADSGKMRMLHQVQVDEQYRQQFIRYKAFAGDMPKSSGTGTEGFKRLKPKPIIPIIDPLVSAEAFIKAGFAIDSIGKYVVFNNQKVMALNIPYMKDHSVSIDDYSKERLEILSKKSGIHYMEVCGFIHYRQSGWAYVWIMSEKQYNAFSKAGHSYVSVDDWSFAFD